MKVETDLLARLSERLTLNVRMNVARISEHLLKQTKRFHCHDDGLENDQ